MDLSALFNGDPKVALLRLGVVALFMLGIFDLETIQSVADESAGLAEKLWGVLQGLGVAAVAGTSTNRT